MFKRCLCIMRKCIRNHQKRKQREKFSENSKLKEFVYVGGEIFVNHFLSNKYKILFSIYIVWNYAERMYAYLVYKVTDTNA